MANFFECVKSRQQPCTPVQIEHRAVTVCHLTNISIRLKRKISLGPGEASRSSATTKPTRCCKREQRAPYLVDSG